MDNSDNSAAVSSAFSTYLQTLGKGSGTVKNYTQDVQRYLIWASIPNTSKLYITMSKIDQFCRELEQRKRSHETIRRMRVSLSTFLVFCKSQGWPVGEPLSNIKSKASFEAYLRSNNYSLNTIRQYSSVISDFEEWLSVQHAHHG